jgi:hypothetical protein
VVTDYWLTARPGDHVQHRREPLRSVKTLWVLPVLLLAACASPSAPTTPPAASPTSGKLGVHRPSSAASTGTPNSPLGVACGVERWHVKTGIDADAAKVNTKPQASTISTLAAIPQPSSAKAKFGAPDKRLAPTEMTTYSLTATVTAYKTEADSDVHLALVDASGKTMIAEIPDPGCVGKTSPFAKQIAASRALWDKTYPPTKVKSGQSFASYVTVNRKVTLTGVGFFDVLHGQRGVAPNGIELHPVLSITLG